MLETAFNNVEEAYKVREDINMKDNNPLLSQYTGHVFYLAILLFFDYCKSELENYELQVE